MSNGNKIQIRWPQHGEVISCSDGNKYTIGKKIGEGAFSIVYSCHDEWDNDLAMKILKPNGKLFETVKASFEKEKETLLKFRHPAVTHIYNAFVCENLFYIITERCAYTIGDLIVTKDFEAEGWIKPMAKSLLQALAEIHAAGYAHRDIHLGNVFTTILTNEYSPGNSAQVRRFKIGDLGISRLVKDMPAAGTMAEWMRPPEVLFPEQFKPIDQRIDIYGSSCMTVGIRSRHNLI